MTAAQLIVLAPAMAGEVAARKRISDRLIFKHCNVCGKNYTHAEWLNLPMVGRQTFTDDGPDLILRNCSCGGTFAVEVPKGGSDE